MGIMESIFGESPFKGVAKHTEKVHECVKLLQPLSEALLNEEYDKIEELHNRMSKTEHEADQIKDQLRDQIAKVYMLSVNKSDMAQFIRMQDGVADSAEDFSVVLLLRKTRMPPELRDDFRAFVAQVVSVSEHLLKIATELSNLAEAAFTGKEAEQVLQAIDQIGYEEWQADRLQRKFARHAYALEDRLDPVTLNFYDKYCRTLSSVANDAERAAKFLRQLIGK